MNTCKTCKYWNVSYNITDGVSDCDRPDCKPDPDKKKTFDIVASADDDSNLHVKLMTGEDFGCILYEPKHIN